MIKVRGSEGWWIVAAVLAGCGPQVPNLDSPGRTIVCLGDSITAGVGAGVGESYPDRLAEKLGVEVVNAGVPGDTAAGGLARLDGVIARQPWLVVVELGGNDLLRQVPIESTERSLRSIVERLLAARAVPLLVEIHGPFGGPYFGNMGEMFERIGDDFDVPVIEDALPEILADPQLKSDQIHPNAAGYSRLADAVAEEVEPLIAARRKAGR